MSELTDTRGKQYGHPSEHFARTVALLKVVFGDRPVSSLRPRDWAVVMVCDKLARLSQTLDHDDSMADIGGYAECWRMCKEVDDRCH